MIVYQSTKQGFLQDVLSNDIENIIYTKFQEKLGRRTNKSEITSWKNSMMYMHSLLTDTEIPSDSGVAIEYQIHMSSKRIDFILTGQDDNNADHLVLIELKQWSEATLTELDGTVVVYVGKMEQEKPHPSYQAWSYAELLRGFNETVYQENIRITPCAYLHNYEQENVLTNSFYAEYISKAPLFLKADAEKLRTFIKRFIKHGDKTDIMYRIDTGKIKPSKNLQDNLSSMLMGNKEFVMIDDQKIVYEKARYLAKQSDNGQKHVFIVEGGPGTGKSIIAINLLVAFTSDSKTAQYVTKNAGPRTVYESKLVGNYRKSYISNFFNGSGSFVDCNPNEFDALIVDEGHRLNEKSGMFQNKGENQIKEIINAAKFSIFFLDEDQKVTLRDIGDKDEVRKWANYHGAVVHETTLVSQFRCNGSDGYLEWLDNTLQIRETANTTLGENEFDFRVMSSPNELRDLIYEKNKIRNKARMVAGYCWDWITKKGYGKDVYDIVFPEYDFKARWNLTVDGSLWIVKPNSVSEIGCIHTCQGLDVDYIGVIIGPDLIVRDGQVITDASKRSKMDSSVKGYKKLMLEDPVNTPKSLDRIIKNTYKTLMTRAMKGCYIYCVDKETENFFVEKISKSSASKD